MSFMGFPDHFLNALEKQQCDREFGDLLFPGPTTKTVLCSIAIIILTIAIETVAHAYKSEDCCYEKDEAGNFIREAPAPTAQSEAAAEQAGGAQTPAPESNSTGASAGESLSGGKKKKKADHDHKPSPTRRANRLVGATALIIPITIAFAVRMQELQISVPSNCQALLNIEPPQWWAIVLFNIIPFICASLAWLRTLVDCILVRWDQTLAMGTWPPAAPLALVAIIITTVVLLLRDVVFLIMGKPDMMTLNQKSSKNDIEMVPRSGVAANDEEMGLMEGLEGQDEVLDDDATVYSPRSSTENKEASLV